MRTIRERLGRLPDNTVREWLDQNAPTIHSLPYVLISSMDSDRHVSLMTWAADRVARDAAWALSTSPLVVSGKSAVDLLDDPSLFTGFDEIWVPSRLPTANPPDEAYLVAPRRLDSEIPAPILEWMRNSECRLGVGDGEGLNYAVADQRLATRLGLE